MNLPAVKDYTAQLGALIQRIDGGAQAISEATAIARASDQSGQRDQALQILQQRGRYEKQVAELTEALKDHARRPDIEAARTLHFDLAARIDLALEEYVRWRRALAEFEFDAGEGAFQTPESRAKAEEYLSKQKELAEKRVVYAAALVPERPVVLL